MGFRGSCISSNHSNRTLIKMPFFLFVNPLNFREISDDLGQPVNCISMSNDGNCILASCLDSTLRLLDR